MDLDTIRQTIIESEADDWHVIVCWGDSSGPSFLQDDGGRPEKLSLDWAERFPDRTVTGSWVDVLWNGSLVDRQIVFNADGGRVTLPAPNWMYHTDPVAELPRSSGST